MKPMTCGADTTGYLLMCQAASSASPMAAYFISSTCKDGSANCLQIKRSFRSRPVLF